MEQQIIKNKLLKFLHKKERELYLYFSYIKNEGIGIDDIETLNQVLDNFKQEKYIKKYTIFSIIKNKNILTDYGISYCLNRNHRNYYLTLKENLYLKNKIQYFYIKKYIVKRWLFFYYFKNQLIKYIEEWLNIINKEYKEYKEEHKTKKIEKYKLELEKYKNPEQYQKIINNLEDNIPDCTPGVYIIINKINLKVYIGSSINIKNRRTQHLQLLLSGTHYNNHLQGAVIKYGIENFQFKILEICEYENINTLRNREQYYLYYYNANNPYCGYNLTLKVDVQFFDKDRIRKCLETKKKNGTLNKSGRKKEWIDIKYFNEWADLYVNYNMSTKDIMLMYDNICSICTVGRVLKSGGVKLRSRFDKIYQEKQVISLKENNKKKWDKWNELYNNGNGMGYKKIAEMYNVSENTVKDKLRKIYGCVIKKEEKIYKGKHLHYKLKWEELYKSGLPILRIANMYNVDHKVVKKVLELDLLKDIKGKKNIHNLYKKGFNSYNEEAEYKKERNEKRKKKQEIWNNIRELWKSGKNDNEIADILNLSVKKVYDYLKSYKKKIIY